MTVVLLEGIYRSNSAKMRHKIKTKVNHVSFAWIWRSVSSFRLRSTLLWLKDCPKPFVKVTGRGQEPFRKIWWWKKESKCPHSLWFVEKCLARGLGEMTRQTVSTFYRDSERVRLSTADIPELNCEAQRGWARSCYTFRQLTRIKPRYQQNRSLGGTRNLNDRRPQTDHVLDALLSTQLLASPYTFFQLNTAGGMDERWRRTAGRPRNCGSVTGRI